MLNMISICAYNQPTSIPSGIHCSRRSLIKQHQLTLSATLGFAAAADTLLFFKGTKICRLRFFTLSSIYTKTSFLYGITTYLKMPVVMLTQPSCKFRGLLIWVVLQAGSAWVGMLPWLIPACIRRPRKAFWEPRTVHCYPNPQIVLSWGFPRPSKPSGGNRIATARLISLVQWKIWRGISDCFLSWILVEDCRDASPLRQAYISRVKQRCRNCKTIKCD